MLATSLAAPFTPVHAEPAAALASGIDRSAFDPAVRAQDDLYRHVNGRWLAHATFPPDKAYIGVTEQLYDRTQDELRELIEAASRRTGDPEAAQIGDLYASFMDEATIEKLGLRPLAGELAAIDAVTDRAQLAALLPRLARLGAGVPIEMYIGQDDRDATRYVPSLVQAGLGLPNRDYYLNLDDAKFRAVREHYVAYLARLLTLSETASDPADSGAIVAAAQTAEATARAILGLETELARVQWSEVENRDPIKAYTLVALSGLSALAPGFDWSAYLDSAGLAGKTPNVIVRQPSYLRAVGALLESVPLATWRAYARVRLLGAYAPYLPKAFVDTRFAFAGTVLAGTPQNRPRWKRGVALVDQSIGEGLGKLYVARYFPPQNKARMEALVANLLAAYRASIATLDWMTPATKQQALAKLAKFNAKIGYPKRWIDYRTLEIRRTDLAGNVMRARRFEDARQLAKLGKPIDRDEWGMTPQTINAYYDPSLNEIVFPAAYLQPPNFDAAADDAVNYGGIGATIGHEISHGFDDEGSQYDGDGNLRDWWTAQDKANFAAKTKLLVAQYSAFVAVPPDYHVNGELTLGENIADNSGLAIAYKAYQLSLAGKPAPVIDGMSGDERFFYGYAQSYRGKARDEALLAQIKSDPHSPDEFRVTGAVRNQPAFYSTFGVKPGDKMYLPPAERVLMW
ncbi:MAG: M13 family metallopeptidase [Burkholderiales bacterium]|nr:M13 family metallopeptidase [Burkholderiales bacterium]